MAKELSGALWVSRFPGSSSTNDLQGTFRASVDNFLRALGNARARGQYLCNISPSRQSISHALVMVDCS